MLRRSNIEVKDSAQGGILRPHGRQFSVHLFFEFNDGSKINLIAWLNTFVRDVTTEEAQKDHAKDYKESGVANQSFLTIGLSENGWEKLAMEEGTFPEPLPWIMSGKVKIDRFGDVEKYAKSLADGKPEEEDITGKYDGMIILANDFSQLVEKKAQEIICSSRKQKALKRYYLQRGNQRTVIGENGRKKSLGPLGYIDGVSEPATKNKVAKSAFFCDAAHPYDKLVGYGSKMVFLKLEVNSGEFHRYLDKLAENIITNGTGIKKPQAIDLAKALLIGRFQNGESLETWNGLKTGEITNDFKYKPSGVSKCPYFSHVRAVNPRVSEGENPIIRRSVPYSEFWNGHFEEGLLFMSYQASIKQQFLPMVSRIQENSDILLYSKGYYGGKRPTHGDTGTVSYTGDFEYNQEEPNITKLHFEQHFYFPSPMRLRLLLNSDSPL